MITPATRSTLFPYTTLFRSMRHRQFTAVLLPKAEIVAYHRPPAAEPTLVTHSHQVEPRGRGDETGRIWFRLLEPELDRKTTRLNSSHANISYAVFCLKKKTR